MTRILFLSANPVEQDRLEVIKEYKKIEFEVKSAKYGSHIDTKPEHEVSLGELQNLLLKFRPRIVHFSGHGSTKGKLVFQDYSTNKADMASSASNSIDNIIIAIYYTFYSLLRPMLRNFNFW
ncbi:MAG TPA: hypothetical protein VFR94_03750 [Nitrososphaeraceae archaeon]|nr:hypothetical protein [Nitrososphaeraceae archaeon]